MKNLKSFLFIALLTIAAVATGENSDSISIAIASTSETKPKRSPLYADVILRVESDRVIVEFNSDLGYGQAAIRNLTNTDVVISSVDAYAGNTEEIFMTIDNISSYSFAITFDDGRYCSIVW